MEDGWIGKATERLFLPLVRLVIPEIVDMNLPVHGVFHNFAIVSIRKRYPGQARKVMHAIWGTGQLMFTKYVIVVDADVDVHDLSEVLWRVGANTDPGQRHGARPGRDGRAGIRHHARQTLAASWASTPRARCPRRAFRVSGRRISSWTKTSCGGSTNGGPALESRNKTGMCIAARRARLWEAAPDCTSRE